MIVMIKKKLIKGKFRNKRDIEVIYKIKLTRKNRNKIRKKF